MLCINWQPRVLAVIDWELCALGNPLADVVYMLLIYLPIPGYIFCLSKHVVLYINLSNYLIYMKTICTYNDIPCQKIYTLENLQIYKQTQTFLANNFASFKKGNPMH